MMTGSIIAWSMILPPFVASNRLETIFALAKEYVLKICRSKLDQAREKFEPEIVFAASEAT